MPICPGCEQRVTYDRLDIHERYCEGIWGGNDRIVRDLEHLEQQILALEERLDGQFQNMEKNMERRLVQLEKTQRQ